MSAIGKLSAAECYKIIRTEGPTLAKEISATAEKINNFSIKTNPLMGAQVPDNRNAILANLRKENSKDAAAVEAEMDQLADLQKKGGAIKDAFEKLQLAFTAFETSYESASQIERPAIEEVIPTEVETNDAAFAAAKKEFEESQKTAPAQLEKAKNAATEAAEFVARVNAEEGQVDAESAEANLSQWTGVAETLTSDILELKKTHAKIHADRIPLANETPNDRVRLASINPGYAAKHEERRVIAENYRTQLDEWKITLGDQLEQLGIAHATLQSSLPAIQAIQANGWKRVQGYLEGFTKVLVNALSGSQTEQYKTQAQRLSDQMGEMSRKIADADEGSLIHDDLNAELATLTAALEALEADFNRLEESDREGLSNGISELKRMHTELLQTQTSGWKKPAESTFYTRIFGK
ncbi:MAG: hypothetical protein ChlgKO_10150 [Chlamydiales bacterium]